MGTLGLQAVNLQAVVSDEAASAIVVSLTDGTVFGPFKLPMSAFRPRGQWGTGIAYLVTDLVSIDGGSYVYIASHTAGASFRTTSRPAGGCSRPSAVRRGRTP